MKRVMKKNPRQNEYTLYLYEHISNVLRSWEEILKPALEEHMDEWDLTQKDIDYIGQSMQHHDESKWEKEEFPYYLDHFYPADGGQVEDNDEPDELFDIAWLHHQHNNPHHWQYWCLIRDSSAYVPLEMPFEYVCEMVCDWHSFSAKYDDNTAYEWYQENGSKMKLNKYTRKYLKHC